MGRGGGLAEGDLVVYLTLGRVKVDLSGHLRILIMLVLSIVDTILKCDALLLLGNLLLLLHLELLMDCLGKLVIDLTLLAVDRRLLQDPWFEHLRACAAPVARDGGHILHA